VPQIVLSTIKAWGWLRRDKPDAVLGFGGYVSIPVGLAAVLAGVPLVLHEQNSVPGLANKILSRWARAVGVTYEEAAAGLAHPERVVLTGNPVRPAVLEASRERGRAALDLPAAALVMLVFGGSRGARHLNSAIVGLRGALVAIPELYVVHVAGALEADAVRASLEAAGGDADGRWRVLDYLDDMGSALMASDLVVARAGATSIAEITALGLPAVLVPFPYATDDHQTKNAAAMVAHGAAELVPDSELDDARFGTVVLELLSQPARRASMAAASRSLGRPDAAFRVANLAREAAGQGPVASGIDSKGDSRV
jgi:UDP-N-acetylglucosamine--N-acetylmuramyl-(pentapeptide) pyrophosphoryl-undecaprenol N-acetylglucosamine transferase